jgi:hypothetical protein
MPLPQEFTQAMRRIQYAISLSHLEFGKELHAKSTGGIEVIYLGKWNESTFQGQILLD